MAVQFNFEIARATSGRVTWAISPATAGTTHVHERYRLFLFPGGNMSEVISNWIGDDGVKYCSVDALFEKLECLDNTDFDNIKEIIHAQNVEDGSEMRELVSILIGRLSWCLVK